MLDANIEPERFQHIPDGLLFEQRVCQKWVTKHFHNPLISFFVTKDQQPFWPLPLHWRPRPLTQGLPHPLALRLSLTPASQCLPAPRFRPSVFEQRLVTRSLFCLHKHDAFLGTTVGDVTPCLLCLKNPRLCQIGRVSVPTRSPPHFPLAGPDTHLVKAAQLLGVTQQMLLSELFLHGVLPPPPSRLSGLRAFQDLPDQLGSIGGELDDSALLTGFEPL